MDQNEIKDKIERYQKKIRELELQTARDEQIWKTKEEEKEKLLHELRTKYPEIDPKNLDEEIRNLETHLESEMLLLDNELRKIEAEIAKNR